MSDTPRTDAAEKPAPDGIHRVWMTAQDLRNKAQTDGWDREWVEDLINKGGWPCVHVAGHPLIDPITGNQISAQQKPGSR